MGSLTDTLVFACWKALKKTLTFRSYICTYAYISINSVIYRITFCYRVFFICYHLKTILKIEEK